MSDVSGRAIHWDLFCRVVDNYGDVGVAWRLARQLAGHPDRTVRLFVDDLHVFGRIEARVDPARSVQTLGQVEVTAWVDAPWRERVPDLVIELFGCGLPSACLDAMAASSHATLWIDLEYLSAESWVDECHGRPSPHPTLPITKHFFYPGFSDATGGLPIEPGLDAARRAFVEDREAVAAFWRGLGIPKPGHGERRLSLFAYRSPSVERLLDAIASTHAERSSMTWSVVLPDDTCDRSRTETRKGLVIHRIPFVGQDDYDRVLWACDANVVRGEDSFVRAQAAARPFLWHIYRQADDAHLVKLHAFEDRYDEALAAPARDANRALWKAWNRESGDLGAAWTAWTAALPELAAHAELWAGRLASRPGLAASLVAWVAQRLPKSGVVLLN